MKAASVASLLLGLGSTAVAQVAKYCPGSGVCYQLNIPSSTAAKGSGDIFFQISGPKSFGWVAMGQGTQMTGAQIFVLYLDKTGKNVTISPRLGKGPIMPEFNPQAQVTLLEGSGIVGNTMVANVKCSSCSSWSGGSMDFSSSSGSFIYAALSSGPVHGGVSATISEHDVRGSLPLNFAQAKGGSSANPFFSSGGSTSCRQRPTSSTTSSGASSGPSSSGSSRYSPWGSQPARFPSPRPTSWRGKRNPEPTSSPAKQNSEDNSNLPFCDELPGGVSIPSSGGGGSLFAGLPAFFSNPETYLLAHGILASLTFVALFPLGAIIIRLLSFPGLVWIHGALQVFAYCVYVAAFGIGVYIAQSLDLLHEYHPIIGMVLFALVFFQPILGFLHHQSFKRQGKRSLVSYAHLWLGRTIITLGIINGGLGLMLADNSHSGKIAYGVIAGVIWLIYVVSIVIGESRRGRAAEVRKQEAIVLPEPTRTSRQ